jgi:hypothetical protein
VPAPPPSASAGLRWQPTAHASWRTSGDSSVRPSHTVRPDPSVATPRVHMLGLADRHRCGGRDLQEPDKGAEGAVGDALDSGHGRSEAEAAGGIAQRWLRGVLGLPYGGEHERPLLPGFWRPMLLEHA